MLTRGKITAFKTASAFSYIEVVISVFILAIGIISLAQLLYKGLGYSIDSRKEVIASQLAQEGIELMRNIRDNNNLQGQDSYYGFPTAPADTCLDVHTDTYGDPLLSSGCASYGLVFDTNTKQYYHGTPSGNSILATEFRRRIAIVNSGNNRRIDSIVWWNGDNASPAICNLKNRCIIAQSIITRWLE